MALRMGTTILSAILSTISNLEWALSNSLYNLREVRMVLRMDLTLGTMFEWLLEWYLEWVLFSAKELTVLEASILYSDPARQLVYVI